MIHKKLMLTNSIIIILSLAIITFVSILTLRKIVYKENSLIYDAMIESTYESIKEEFNATEDFVLHVCTSWGLINLLNEESLPDKQVLKEALTAVQYGNNYDSVVVLPVKGQDVYLLDDESGEWDKQSDTLQYYPHEYEFEWHFRPDNKPCYRVMKAMHSQKEDNEVIAIVYVDMALTALAEKVYGFASASDIRSEMYLLDENYEYMIPYHLKGRSDLAAEGQKTDSVKYSLSGDKLSVVKRFPKNDWKLAAVIYESVLYKLSDGDLFLVYGGSAALGMLAIIFTNLITRRLTSPILNLADSMQQSGSSERFQSLPVPRDADAEVRTLYESYNYLVAEVNQSITNIQEISKKEQENQFMLLQAQVNPHFLYNTLNTISWLAQNRQNEEIQKMVVAMVRLFRTSLNNGKPLVTVSQEMENVCSYLQIMQYRYPESYAIEFDVAENSKPLIIIKQILQPLAENALMHGFVEVRKDGVIRVSSAIDDDHLVLKMVNSGSEIDLDLVGKLLDHDPAVSSRHYGIRNVNDRLIQYYGPESGLKYSIEDGLTVVSISLPLAKVREQFYG